MSELHNLFIERYDPGSVAIARDGTGWSAIVHTLCEVQLSPVHTSSHSLQPVINLDLIYYYD